MRMEWLIQIVLIVVAARVAIYVADTRAKKRMEALRQVSEELGFRVDPKPRHPLPPQAAGLDLFKRARSAVRNLLHGQHCGREVRVFDYSYIISQAKRSSR
jgi:hypothetical protein